MKVPEQDAVQVLVNSLGMGQEEAERMLQAFKTPLPARARLRSGLVVRLLPGCVSDRVARDMVKRGWLVPDAR